MPDPVSRVKAILKSAELIFELGIINPTRFGPVIHANVPDYAEILIRTFIDDKTGRTPNDNFPNLVPLAKSHLAAPFDSLFQLVADYFINTRATFRNPLHHTDRVQGYVIEYREALNCLLKFDDLLNVLFPGFTSSVVQDLNYPSYVRYLRMEHDESLGKGNHELYQATIAALHRMEKRDKYRSPSEFDASRLIAVRRLFRYDDQEFAITVLHYRPILVEKIVTLLDGQGTRFKVRHIYLQLKDVPELSGLNENEIRACLKSVEGERLLGKGYIRNLRGAYFLSP